MTRHQTCSLQDDVPTAKLVARPRKQVFEKDVLRVGRWQIQGRFWNVTQRTLTRIVLNFQKARQRGIRIPVVWNHSHDVRDKIGEIVRLYVSGNALRAVFWAVHPEDVKRLENTATEMSVEVAEPWRDGHGRFYDLFLTHLAVVNHPVVSEQGPLRRLSLNTQIRTPDNPIGGFVSMNQPAALSATPLTGNQTSSVADLINQIVAALGASFTIPTDTNSDEFLDNLRQLRDKVDALAESETDPMRHTASLDEDPSVETLQSRLDEVTRQLALERRRSREDRAKHFESAVDRLIGDGRVSPADKPSLLATGDIANYSLSLLAPFQRIPLGAAVPTRPVARRSATAHPPNILPDTPIDDERARRIANDFAP